MTVDDYYMHLFHDVDKCLWIENRDFGKDFSINYLDRDDCSFHYVRSHDHAEMNYYNDDDDRHHLVFDYHLHNDDHLRLEII